MSTNFKIVTTRVRVQLKAVGEDVFAECEEAIGMVILEKKGLSQLCSELKKIILESEGELVEVADGKISWDTPDLTIYAEVYNEDGSELTQKEIKKNMRLNGEIELMMPTTQTENK